MRCSLRLLVHPIYANVLLSITVATATSLIRALLLGANPILMPASAFNQAAAQTA